MSKYTTKEIKAVIDTLESEDVQGSLSDGYGYYTGSNYGKVLKRIAEKLLKAIDKARGK